MTVQVASMFEIHLKLNFNRITKRVYELRDIEI